MVLQDQTRGAHQMHIGTVRPEEARVSDTYAGYHRFHASETQEEHGSFEIFWHNGPSQFGEHSEEEDYAPAAGWYWHSCFPGCLPDNEAVGPFASSRLALRDADEWHPELD
jgi:hypothetical protein